MLETKIYTKEIDLGPQLGTYIVQVELDKFEGSLTPHCVSTRHELKGVIDEERDIVTPCDSESLDETLKKVVQSKNHLLMEEEREDTLRFLKNRGFNPFYETTKSGIIL